MTDNTYNGWTGNGTRASAYATWRVNLELVSDIVDELIDECDGMPEGSELADALRDYVYDVVMGDDYDCERLVSQYADAFLDDVNWEEIADVALSGWKDD